ncbi:DUF975 family protein [Pontiellaceae bacterium B12227]|nr:DUF975 family protein [Pontiellaceae bacterium B12227]
MAGQDGSSGDIPKILTSTSNDFTGGVGGGGGGVTSNKDLMAEARESLSGNWGMGVLGYFLYTLLSTSISFFVFAAALFVGVVSGISGSDPEVAGNAINVFAQFFQFIIYGPLIVGFYGFYLGIAQEDEGRLELLFIGFRRFWKSFAMYFLSSLFVLLWMILFIIPGIIAAFRYSMAYFCIADDEDCGPLEAIQLSKEMMKGNKWKFFCLNCRFIGWWLLATIFTLGIGYLWLVPYIHTSYAKFYEDVR